MRIMITPTSNNDSMGDSIIIIIFLDNAEFTKSNSLTHLDFDHEDEHNDLLESIQTFHYFTYTDIIKEMYS